MAVLDLRIGQGVSPFSDVTLEGNILRRLLYADHEPREHDADVVSRHCKEGAVV